MIKVFPIVEDFASEDFVGAQVGAISFQILDSTSTTNLLLNWERKATSSK